MNVDYEALIYLVTCTDAFLLGGNVECDEFAALRQIPDERIKELSADSLHDLVNMCLKNRDMDLMGRICRSARLADIDVACASKDEQALRLALSAFPGHPSQVLADVQSMGEILNLVLLGADVDFAGDRGNTALHDAVVHRNEEVVVTLLACGASNRANDAQTTPLMIARAQPDGIVKLLLERAFASTPNKREHG